MADEMDQDAIRRALEEVANQPGASGRAAMAKVTALRSLERIHSRRRRQQRNPPPEDALDSVAPADYWHPGPDEFKELDVHDTIRTRERWRANLESEL